MIDVLLINPGGKDAVFQGLEGAGLTAVEPPIWCRLIASSLYARDLSVHIIDSELYGLSPYAAAVSAAAIAPRLVVVVVHGQQPSASTQKMPAATATVKALKAESPATPVIVVGGHPSALPYQTLKETGADFVCTGEGPATISDLVYNLAHNRSFVSARGLAWLDGWGNLNNSFSIAPNVDDLDKDMPGDSWRHTQPTKYRSYAHHAWSNNFERSPYASIYTSLGCPYACNFCMIQHQFSLGDKLTLRGKANSYRMWSAEAVIKEISCLVDVYGVKNIRVNDEMFVLNEHHVLSICDKIIERYGDSLNFWAYGRVDQTKEKFLDKMRKAGFKWLCLGIESLSDQVRDGIDKGQYGAEDIYKTVYRVQDHGINIIANYMFGLPGDTYESMEQTLNLALDLKTEYVNMYAVVAYPGSKLWDDKIAEGWQPPKDWLAWSFHSYEHEPLGTEELPPAEVLKFRDYAFKRYFIDTAYRDYVLEKFGQRAIDEIDFMLSHKLRRKLLGD